MRADGLIMQVGSDRDDERRPITVRLTGTNGERHLALDGVEEPTGQSNASAS